jgi:uncharacterized membrane protein
MERKLLDDRLARWRDAGLIDDATAERLRAWEAQQPAAGHASRLGRLAFGFGGLLLAAGLLLFVAANWDQLSPWGRFALIACTVGALHLLGGLAEVRAPALATTLHAVGTAAFGAGIFLAGQTFNLAEHWPEGFLLWALGAAAALWWLRDWPHASYVALLVPLWLVSLWADTLGFEGRGAFAVPATGVFVLGVAYLAAECAGLESGWRLSLARLGAVLVLIAGSALPFAAFEHGAVFGGATPAASAPWLALGWGVASLAPLAVGYGLRGREAWPLAAALAFALVVTRLDATSAAQRTLLHLCYLAAAVGLTAWGVRDAHRLRVNVGVVAFALTVLSFYYSSVFDRIGRSLGLISLGVLFIGGGWLLARTRRRLLERIEGART